MTAPAAVVAVGADAGGRAAGEELVTLVRGAQAGDRAALAALYERHRALVHGVLLAHAHTDDVADVMQDVFVTVLEEVHALRDAGAFGAWVAAVARNRARLHARRRRATVELSPELSEAIPAPPALGPEGAEAFAALRSLPETYREPLLLRLVEGLSGAEIAERLGLTHGTVRVYLHRGMQMLRDRLGEGRRERGRRQGGRHG